jgi:putative glutamine amidotransferase
LGTRDPEDGSENAGAIANLVELVPTAVLSDEVDPIAELIGVEPGGSELFCRYGVSVRPVVACDTALVASSKVPLVGVTTYRQDSKWGLWDRPAAVLQSAYVDCVAAAGGRPVLLPPLSGPGLPEDWPPGVAGASASAAADAVAEGLDAIVLTGGADLVPALYGEAEDPETQDMHPWRDESEVPLLQSFLAAGKPIFGVCRGIQIINAFLGGTLYQHLPNIVHHTGHRPGPGQFGETKVQAVEGSLVAKVMGDTPFTVLCSHHQAIDRVADALQVTARADDGTIEALEPVPGVDPRIHGFLLAVQWHPEQSMNPALFRSLVEAAS